MVELIGSEARVSKSLRQPISLRYLVALGSVASLGMEQVCSFATGGCQSSPATVVPVVPPVAVVPVLPPAALLEAPFELQPICSKARAKGVIQAASFRIAV